MRLLKYCKKKENGFRKEYRKKAVFFPALFCCLLGLLFGSSSTVKANELTPKQEIESVIRQECIYYQVESEGQLIDQIYAADCMNGINQSFVLTLLGYHPQGDYDTVAVAIKTIIEAEEAGDNVKQSDNKAYGQSDREAYKQKKPVESQKLALLLIALSEVGVSDANINALAEPEVTDIISDAVDGIGQQGIMSYICGLQLVSNLSDSEEKAEEAIQYLISCQLEDGGFALLGNSGDADVTAMALQALAPYRDESKSAMQLKTTENEIDDSIEKGLQFLSSCQTEDGDIVGFGSCSSESTAQVILSLCALGIDYRTDERFLVQHQDGSVRNLLDGLHKYRLDDGSYCHTVGQSYNEMATAEALTALVAIYRFQQGLCPIFSYTDYTEEEKLAIEEQVTINEVTGNKQQSGFSTTGATEYLRQNRKAVKWLLIGVIWLCGMVYSLLIIRKKSPKRKQKIESAVLICIAFSLLTALVDIKSVDEYYSTEQENNNRTISVVMSISCGTVAEKDSRLPEDGFILEQGTVEMEEGSTALDCLLAVTKENRIQIDYQGSGNGSFAYIRGMHYLYEGDYGDLSGWMYRVNGEFVSVGCGEYVLQEGDVIEWVYSLEMGQDL